MKRAALLVAAVIVAFAGIVLACAGDATGAAAPLLRRQAPASSGAPACCAGSGPLACTGICGCPASGGNLLLCDDFTRESLAQVQVNWGISAQDMIVTAYTLGTMGGNEGCLTASNVSVGDAGLAMATTTYDGGACPLSFDAGTAVTPTCYASELWTKNLYALGPSRAFIYEQTLTIPSPDGSCATDAGDCWDPGGIVLGPECHPHPGDGGPATVPAANYTPFAPQNGCTPSPSNFPFEIDPWEIYSPGTGTPASPGVGGPKLSNHSLFNGATSTINPQDYSANYGQVVTITEVWIPGTSTKVYWNGVLKHTIAGGSAVASEPVFLLLQSRAWNQAGGFVGPKTLVYRSIKLCEGPLGATSCN